MTLMLATALVLGAGAAGASAGGNSANAKACQGSGWKYWTQSDGTPFASQSACVSYAAQGGKLTPPNLGF